MKGASKSRVAVLKVTPSSVLDDIERLCELGQMRAALDRRATTILKDNMSWHFPFPSANTTPLQLEGSILALRAAGYDDVVCVQNKTVVTDAFKGEDLTCEQRQKWQPQRRDRHADHVEREAFEGVQAAVLAA